jgi:hypothetical protein
VKDSEYAFGSVTIETVESAWGGKGRANSIDVNRSAYQASRSLAAPVSSIFLHCVKTMACPKCGCRLLTKVGRSKQMLICSDCSHPREPSFDQLAFQWRQLSTLMLVLMVAGVAVFHTMASDIASSKSTPLNRESQIEKTN